MASKGPKTSVRKPAVPKAATPAPIVSPTPMENADVETPPVPFVATPEIAPAIEAVVEEAAKQREQVVSEMAESADEAIDTVNHAAATAAASTEDEIMATTYDAAATAENAAAKAQNLFGEMNERTKSAFEKGAKGLEEWNDMAKGNVEALVESGRIAAKGFESRGQNAADYGRRSFESATATMKTLASAKSPTEFMKLHSDYVRQSFDTFVAEASKTTETMLKLAGDAAQPISNRVAMAAEKAKPLV